MKSKKAPSYIEYCGPIKIGGLVSFSMFIILFVLVISYIIQLVYNDLAPRIMPQYARYLSYVEVLVVVSVLALFVSM